MKMYISHTNNKPVLFRVYLFEKQSVRDRQTAVLHALVSTASVGPGRSHEPETPPGSPRGYKGPKHWNHLSLPSQAH